jgi:F-type H+-transporting ATPase subunit epsilon
LALTFHVDIVSTTSSIFSGKAERIIAPADQGELAVLARHAPLLSRLKSGLIRVVQDDGHEEHFFVSSGLLEIQPHVVTVLADTVLRTEELDEHLAMKAKQRTEEALQSKLSDTEYNKLKQDLNIQVALLRSIDQLKSRKIIK